MSRCFNYSMPIIALPLNRIYEFFYRELAMSTVIANYDYNKFIDCRFFYIFNGVDHSIFFLILLPKFFRHDVAKCIRNVIIMPIKTFLITIRISVDNKMGTYYRYLNQFPAIFLSLEVWWNTNRMSTQLKLNFWRRHCK